MNFGNCSNWIVATHSFAVSHSHAHHHFISENSFIALSSQSHLNIRIAIRILRACLTALSQIAENQKRKRIEICGKLSFEMRENPWIIWANGISRKIHKWNISYECVRSFDKEKSKKKHGISNATRKFSKQQWAISVEFDEEKPTHSKRQGKTKGKQQQINHVTKRWNTDEKLK